MEKMARQLSPSNGVLKSLLENPLKLPFQHDGGKAGCGGLLRPVAGGLLSVNSKHRGSALSAFDIWTQCQTH
jgi:hypothetical protein